MIFFDNKKRLIDTVNKVNKALPHTAANNLIDYGSLSDEHRTSISAKFTNMKQCNLFCTIGFAMVSFVNVLFFNSYFRIA